MRRKQMEMQIGKSGLTPEFLEDLKRRFEGTENMRVHVLKSARESKTDVKKYAEKIVGFLGEKFTYRVLGFIIILKKWRKVRG